ncbi:MAG: gliding motility-associated C-terminal domain-containing protein [Bacteroidota bacterium]
MNTLLPLCSLRRSRKFNAFFSLLIFSFVFLYTQNSNAQGPGSLFVDAGPDVTIPCGGTGCVDITADFLQTFETIDDTYTIDPVVYAPPFPFNGLANSLNPDIDDAWSVVETLPFDFCYFQNIETQFQVGSNGVIRFDVDAGDTSNGWQFTEDLPNNTNETLGEANVFTPGHDIDPSVSTTEEIGYEVLGEAPNRVLVVAYYEVPMFSATCNALLATQMVVFYEFSNVIEIYVQDKPSCPTWNDGNATMGIQNNDGDIAFVPAGRNTSDSPWTATEEAWRFTPAGDATYVFEWLDGDGNTIGTDPTINVCPSTPEIYTAKVTYTNCNGDVVILTDEVLVTPEAEFTLDLGGDQVFCDTPEYEIVPTLTGDITGATYLWSTGETTPTITVSTTDTYSVEVTVDSCTLTDDVEITFLTSPDCFIEPICTQVDFNEDFGTGTGLECDLMGATTTYTCWDGVGQLDDGEYILSNTADGLNNGWHLGMEDHTEGDVDGRALFVNAEFTPGEFYRRTITLSENIDYTFNAWITTVYDTDTGICGGTGIPSNVIFRIEDPGGATIAEVETGDIENGPEPNWQEFSIAFNTGANTDVQLVLINNSIGGCGNDLAIDDITLSLENLEPQIVTPDDLTACDETGGEEATFDLTSQIPTILDGQDPVNFEVSFHLAQLDAEANTNPIATPTAYVNTTNPETIYVRVERASEETCFSTVNFDLLVGLVVDFETELEPVIDLCSTDPFPVLDATPTNSGLDLTLVTYEWTDGSGTVVSTDATYTPTAADTYSVTISLPPCSQETIAVEVNVTETPVLDLGVDQVLCDGGIFDIIPDVTGNTTGITYAWSTGETTPTITVDATGTYTLEITVGACVVTDSIDIFISDPIEVTIGEDFKTCPDETQILTATSSDPDVTYQWFVNGDLITGATDQGLEFTIEPGTMGTQIYSVVVSKGDCTGEAEIGISLYDVGNCVISQGISPNNDGFNDSLDLEFLSDRAGGISQLQIFNRHGLQVFEAVNYVNEWQGQDRNGNELPTGTYFYVIDLVEEDPVFGQQATGWIYINKEAN